MSFRMIRPHKGKAAAVKQSTCTCAHVNPPAARFCGNCGNKLIGLPVFALSLPHDCPLFPHIISIHVASAHSCPPRSTRTPSPRPHHELKATLGPDGGRDRMPVSRGYTIAEYPALHSPRPNATHLTGLQVSPAAPGWRRNATWL